MGKKPLILPQTVMRELLDNACSNPYYPENFDYSAAEKKMMEWNENRDKQNVAAKNYPDPPGGWHVYRIETHCKAYDIVARKSRNSRTKKETWQIKSFELVTN